jgi:predicted lactoylglutathione lyase
MIGYVTLGTNDLERAAKFHDALIAELGGKRFMEEETFIAWAGPDPNAASYALTKPYDGEAASVGNGVMVAIACDKPETVDRLYKKAIDLGAADEGAPGPRGGGFYAGYFRDPDGHKFNFFCMAADS